jgi:hypothetical protein
MAVARSFPSDSKGAVNIVLDLVATNAAPRRIDPSDPDYPRLLDLKRRLDAAKKKGKRRENGDDSKRRGK